MPDEYRDKLTPEEYRILREKGTERPFTGTLLSEHRDGIYRCRACDAPLFPAGTKFDSGTGWPSFDLALPGAVEKVKDESEGMARTEVRCAKCHSHLGHVFEDGPTATGLRYCVNSACLAFQPRAGAQKAAFAAGCFWHVEHAFRQVNGVTNATSGYMGGTVADPTYEQVCRGGTGHAETVLVEFDPSVVSFEKLLDAFWRLHDPTQKDRQGPDVGRQYRSVVFTFSPEQRAQAEASKARREKEIGKTIATVIEPAGTFYRAEEYHQRYVEKHGRDVCPL